jgi:hypothetical protein
MIYYEFQGEGLFFVITAMVVIIIGLEWIFKVKKKPPRSHSGGF